MNTKKSNIIYILGDDHRFDYLGCSGHPLIETPNIDFYAKNGIFFKNAFCTSPVCTPSRVCHYLGQWERQHGINFNSNSSLTENTWEKSFPMILKENGYFIGWVGKNHVPAGNGGYESGYFEKSFDYWYGNHGHSFFYVKEHSNGKIYNNSKYDTQVEVFEEGVMNFLDPQPDFLNSCISPLPIRPKDKPFCLCITFNLPHDCGTADMQLRPTDDPLYITKYRDLFSKFPLPATYKCAWENYEPKLPFDVYNGVQIPYYDYVRLPETMREKIVRTAQTITGVDRMIGNLRDKLKELCEENNTIIIFSTDHGLHFGEFGLGGKNFLYEPDIRVPMILYDPSLAENKRGKTINKIVAVPDLAPTVLNLAGIDIPDTMQGNSLVPLINGDETTWRTELFTEALMDIQNYPRSECVRSEKWKYIRYFRRTEDPNQLKYRYKGTLDNYNTTLVSTLYYNEQPIYEELFDLDNDPSERINLAGEKKNVEVLQYFRKRVMELGKIARGDNVIPCTYDYQNNL